MSRRRKHRKSRKRLTYGIITVAFILICIVTYSYLHSSNQNPPNPHPPNQLPSKAAIVDHLSLTAPNQTFKNSSISILEAAGFDVTYYPGKDVTVNFYRNLVSHNYGLIVFRVHSAIIGNSTRLGLFTSELFDENKYNTPSAPYYDDIVNAKPQRIVKAYFPDDPIQYFAIAPEFIEKYGNFQNTTIIMMGCDGIKYNAMAEAFRRKGAKICIGWDGLVSAPHTDHGTTCLLQHLAQGETVAEAVTETMKAVGPDPEYESRLKHYPGAAGSYTIQSIIYGAFSTILIRANTMWAKEQ